jgi:hypothetical protein
VVDRRDESRLDAAVPDLYLHGREIHTVFELLGVEENDITYSLGWCLSESEALANALARKALGKMAEPVEAIRLQDHVSGKGITDIQLHAGPDLVVVEAKRGWSVPTREQLELYAGRRPQPSALLALSECSQEYADTKLVSAAGGVPVRHLSWKEVAVLTRKVLPETGLHERHLLNHFLSYLGRAMPIQNKESNAVFVVALSTETPKNSGISWIDISEKEGRYFHPIGNNWPKTPPNYMGFRYHGRLQCIRHVDDYEVGTNPHKFIPAMASEEWDTPHFFYKLGPRIVPPTEVKTGNLYMNSRVWVAFDLLLTSKTIAEARDKTQERLATLED